MVQANALQMLDRDWLSVAQTAAYLQVSTRTVHRYLDSGRLSYSQLVPGGGRSHLGYYHRKIT